MQKVIVIGGTGSGKTTFLNALSCYIPKDERIITIEDSAELQTLEIPNLVRMETRNANVEGCREITIRDLIKTSLRMRPDRIIVGEVRGGEAFDMMQCLNTGHLGLASLIPNDPYLYGRYGKTAVCICYTLTNAKLFCRLHNCSIVPNNIISNINIY